MKLSLAGLPVLALCLVAAACGSSTRAPDSRRAAFESALLGGYLPDTYRTTTPNGVVYDGDDGSIRFYGGEADAADRAAVQAVVKRYYTALARNDGAAACALMHPLLAESIPEQLEQLHVHVQTCPAVLSALFAPHRRELSRESATLEMLDVRVQGGVALALLRFARGSEPERLALHREGAGWRIWEVQAGQMP